MNAIRSIILLGIVAVLCSTTLYNYSNYQATVSLGGWTQ